MVDFYRTKECAFCDDVEAHLKELVLAHRIHLVSPGEATEAPVLVEGRRRYTTREAILAFLTDIGQEMVIQREMQGDTCKVNEC